MGPAVLLPLFRAARDREEADVAARSLTTASTGLAAPSTTTSSAAWLQL
jgi:hypothetical protein